MSAVNLKFSIGDSLVDLSVSGPLAEVLANEKNPIGVLIQFAGIWLTMLRSGVGREHLGDREGLTTKVAERVLRLGRSQFERLWTDQTTVETFE